MAENWCRVCGNKYKVCSSCENVRKRTPWRVITDTAQHYQVWLAVNQYQSGLITKQEAQEVLKRSGVSKKDIKTFIPSVRALIQEINKTDAPVASDTE